MTAADAERAIGEQRVAAIIVVPENFDQAVAMGNAAVDLYLNNVDIDCRRHSPQRNPFGGRIRRAAARPAGRMPVRRRRLLPNPIASLWPSATCARPTFPSCNIKWSRSSCSLLSVLAYWELRCSPRASSHGTAKMLLLSPAGRLSLVLGRLLGGTLITIALITPLVGFGFVTRHIPYCTDDCVPQGQAVAQRAMRLVVVDASRATRSRWWHCCWP